jgi:DNA-binding transcriptional LysR family regulator
LFGHRFAIGKAAHHVSGAEQKGARRVLSTLEQAKASAKAAATGYRGTLRIALSDGIAPPRLAALLAQNREEEPEVEIRLFETTLAQQLKGLCSGLYDAGFAHAGEVGEGIIAEPSSTAS